MILSIYIISIAIAVKAEEESLYIKNNSDEQADL
jgi:hypothetical protein